MQKENQGAFSQLSFTITSASEVTTVWCCINLINIIVIIIIKMAVKNSVKLSVKVHACICVWFSSQFCQYLAQ